MLKWWRNTQTGFFISRELLWGAKLPFKKLPISYFYGVLLQQAVHSPQARLRDDYFREGCYVYDAGKYVLFPMLPFQWSQICEIKLNLCEQALTDTDVKSAAMFISYSEPVLDVKGNKQHYTFHGSAALISQSIFIATHRDCNHPKERPA